LEGLEFGGLVRVVVVEESDDDEAGKEGALFGSPHRIIITRFVLQYRLSRIREECGGY
jgi:hypothetical protein